MTLLNEDSTRKCLVNVEVGEDVRIFNFVNAYGCTINSNSKIGAFVEIQKGARIGKNCKISSHTFICEGVDIEDNVFVGHNVSFINDLAPRATNPDGSAQNEEDWTLVRTKICMGASIGTSVTVLGGVTIGENSLIGAGSVVTKNIPANSVAFGNPAKVVRSIH
jgi:acetyltransferase-like isoleucine patch superfamily enzyme